jgi:antirestriction protein ArdC
MNVYETITAKILTHLEQGVIPWQQPWNHTAGIPRNLLSQKAYRGINVWVLASAGYSSPYWLTCESNLSLGNETCGEARLTQELRRRQKQLGMRKW